ncbi:2Fe-2S iron-sulfur cluster binding domain-containing protein [Sinorhizobium meliloti]
MVSITFVHDGIETKLEASGETTVMELAVRNDIPGIIGECGGATVCGTCHVAVDEVDISRLPPAAGSEIDLLEALEDVNHRSRLSCCLKISQKIDGLRVHCKAHPYA